MLEENQKLSFLVYVSRLEKKYVVPSNSNRILIRQVTRFLATKSDSVDWIDFGGPKTPN